MKREKMKAALVLVFFALVVAASLVFPALGLDWQDRRIGNQVQFETIDEVALRREDIFSLEEKIRLFSNYNSNAQIAVINRNELENDELEEVMNQAVFAEFRKLCDLGLLWGYPYAESLDDIGYMDHFKNFVFDQKNPSKSMIIWTYVLPVDGDLGSIVLNLEQESKKILGFSCWRWDRNSSFDTEITEDMIHAFAGYLGYVGYEVKILEGVPKTEDYAGYPGEEMVGGVSVVKYSDGQELWEETVVNAAAEYGEDIWGNPWREIYQIKMGEEDADGMIDYWITASEGGFVFGTEMMYY